MLEEESLSINELAKKMGYKGISKSLSNSVQELESNSYVKQTKRGRRL